VGRSDWLRIKAIAFRNMSVALKRWQMKSVVSTWTVASRSLMASTSRMWSSIPKCLWDKEKDQEETERNNDSNDTERV
jgi:hypothetical protein